MPSKQLILTDELAQLSRNGDNTAFMTGETYWHNSKITRLDRQHQNGHKAVCVWFTGLSGSGKSTLAVELEDVLFKQGAHVYVLDGDNIRQGLNSDLGFTDKDRKENIRRIGHVAKLIVDAGTIAITAFISPFKEDRIAVRRLFDEGQFIEVYVSCDLETCTRRDPKGLYARALSGDIDNFTGISSAYEAPDHPEVVVENNDSASVVSNVKRILKHLRNAGIIDLPLEPRGARST